MHCPECGFVNADGANYCQKCGAFLAEAEKAAGDTTASFQLDETGELKPVDIEQATAQGATLAIRSGGGRTGEVFDLAGDQMRIGRSPEAEVFLDDVTVSRNHALLVRRRDGLYVDDLGSLNGTYVNRHRIESHRLTNGDELQVGKYKLTYLERP
jgi:pSer/pThr/pTyr-binding forkhead associated (FHA) protein